MNTIDVFENCIRIERIIGQIYGIFMKQQASCFEHASLWEKMEQEENNHEQQFVLAKRLACTMKTDTTNIPHPSNELIKKLGEVKARIVEAPLSPVESIRLAINLEEKLSLYHMNQMQIFSDESANTLFKSMMKNDNEHIDALKRVFAKLS